MSSFFPQGIKLWNALPQHLIDSPDLSTFKEGLNNLHYTLLVLIILTLYTCTTILCTLMKNK